MVSAEEEKDTGEAGTEWKADPAEDRAKCELQKMTKI